MKKEALEATRLCTSFNIAISPGHCRGRQLFDASPYEDAHLDQVLGVVKHRPRSAHNNAELCNELCLPSNTILASNIGERKNDSAAHPMRGNHTLVKFGQLGLCEPYGYYLQCSPVPK